MFRFVDISIFWKLFGDEIFGYLHEILGKVVSIFSRFYIQELFPPILCFTYFIRPVKNRNFISKFSVGIKYQTSFIEFIQLYAFK